MQAPAEAPRLPARDGAIALAALVFLTALSWGYLLRDAGHDMGSMSTAEPAPPSPPDAAPEEEEDEPRLP